MATLGLPWLEALLLGSIVSSTDAAAVFAVFRSKGMRVRQRVARLLGLQRPPVPEPPVSLEITSLRDVDGDIVEYSLGGDFPAAGRRIRDLSLPDGALVAMVARGQHVLAPRGSTQLLAGDHVFVILRRGTRWLVDRVFRSGGPGGEPSPPGVEFPLRGGARLAELEEFYGIHIDAPGSDTLDEFLRARLEGGLEPGRSLTVGPVTLTVRDVLDGRVETVGLSIASAPGPSGPDQDAADGMGS